jgi:hypothetical protein
MNRIKELGIGFYNFLMDLSLLDSIKSDRKRDSLMDDLDVFYNLISSTGGKDSPHYERYLKLEKEVEKLNKARQNLLTKSGAEEHAN